MKISQFIVLLLIIVYTIPTFAQQGKELSIAGTIVDINKNPLPNVSIYVKDKPSIGSSTDDKGRFNLKVLYGDKIVFSYVGFETVEHLSINDKDDLLITLIQDNSSIDEVVVVGLGNVQRKISSVGAISTVDPKDLQSPAPSITNLLGGRAAGVISMQASGEPGKNIAEFWVRGIGTFGANNSALVLIDGLEGNLNTIDPADIESFSILKDASATAVYGVRGANGVVLVTTKRGLVDRIQLTARVNTTLSTLNRLPKYVDAYNYALLANEASVIRGNTPIYNQVELGIIKDGLDPDLYPNVNWQDEILNKNFWSNSYYVSGRGGSEVARYFLSLGGKSQTAAYKVDKNSPYSSNVGFNSYSYRINLDVNLTKSTKVFLGSDGFLSILTQPGIANTDYIWGAQSSLTPLTIPTQFTNGLLPGRGKSDQSSPYVMINRTGKAADEEYRGKTTLSLNQDLSSVLDGLKFRVQGAYDIYSYFNERRRVQPALYNGIGRAADGSLITILTVPEEKASYKKETRQFRKYFLETVINYDKVFNNDHRTSALIYYYLSDSKDTKDAISNLESIPLRYQGVSSRVTYGYKDTYLLDANFGYTGSENFQPGRQYGFFPSVALGWVPSSYRFVQESAPWLNYFKIRASYGSVGNDRISNTRFPYLTKVNQGTTQLNSDNDLWGIGGVETIGETRIGADNLAWERAIKSNIGFEGKIFNNKLDFVFDIFKDERNGIFQQRVQVPDYVGVLNNPFANVGRMQSSGMDGNISYKGNITKDINFTLRGNFTYAKNMVKNWEQAYLEYPYLEYNNFPHKSIRGLQALGLFKDQDDINYSPQQTFGAVMPGDIKYKDINGDGIIDNLDKVPLAQNDEIPLIMYGFGGQVSYKKISLGVLFKGTGSSPFFYGGIGYRPFYEGAIGNVLDIVADPSNRWIPKEYAILNGIDPNLSENPNAKFPRLSYGGSTNNNQTSTFWQSDAKYIRLQEVTINYNLNPSFLRKAGIKSMDLQFVGNNLYTWDTVKIFDPEQARFNGRKYPIPSTYSVQIYINF